MSYGMLLHGLVSCGHGGVVQLAKDQGEVWRSILEREVGMWRINVTKNNFRIMIMITAVGWPLYCGIETNFLINEKTKTKQQKA